MDICLIYAVFREYPPFFNIIQILTITKLLELVFVSYTVYLVYYKGMFTWILTQVFIKDSPMALGVDFAK